VPSETAFQVTCDMSTDTGGWVELANVGDTLRESHLGKDVFLNGIGNPAEDEEYVIACDKFNGLDGNKDADELTAVVLRVTLGEVRDYFKPVQGADLCTMLTSHNKHMWSADGGFEDDEEVSEDDEAEEEEADKEGGDGEASLLEERADLQSEDAMSESEYEAAEAQAAARFAQRLRARVGRQLLAEPEEESSEEELSEEDMNELAKWRTPEYIEDKRLAQLLGGSSKGWPADLDGRQYLSFWGGDKGLCCHYQSTVYSDVEEADAGSWGRAGKLHIIEMPEEGGE